MIREMGPVGKADDEGIGVLAPSHLAFMQRVDKLDPRGSACPKD